MVWNPRAQAHDGVQGDPRRARVTCECGALKFFLNLLLVVRGIRDFEDSFLHLWPTTNFSSQL
jgi:hypothetical protein